MTIFRNRAYEVSIHAPARGATYPAHTHESCSQWFQSTRPHGARLRMDDQTRRQIVFQSTRPHGARLLHLPHSAGHPACFNPRARTGRDFCGIPVVRRSRCFNPRARTGRDLAVHRVCRKPNGVSIHAPARGATVASLSLAGTRAKQKPFRYAAHLRIPPYASTIRTCSK